MHIFTVYYVAVLHQNDYMCKFNKVDFVFQKKLIFFVHNLFEIELYSKLSDL